MAISRRPERRALQGYAFAAREHDAQPYGSLKDQAVVIWWKPPAYGSSKTLKNDTSYNGFSFWQKEAIGACVGCLTGMTTAALTKRIQEGWGPSLVGGPSKQEAHMSPVRRSRRETDTTWKGCWGTPAALPGFLHKLSALLSFQQ